MRSEHLAPRLAGSIGNGFPSLLRLLNGMSNVLMGRRFAEAVRIRLQALNLLV
jgi:hypothetical protein